MPDYELRIPLDAADDAHAHQWTHSITTLLTRTYGRDSRMHIGQPRLINPPGATTEQLPADVLAFVNTAPYLSTACQTADACTTAITRHPDHATALAEWASRLHARCRENQKFTGQPCACTHHRETKSA